MNEFKPLTTALAGWFDKPFADLPEAIQTRVQADFFPMPWDSLSKGHRESFAKQWDYNHDPATEQERHYWWDFFVKKEELEKQSEQWKTIAASSAGELAEKEQRLKALAIELERMQKIEEHARGDYLTATSDSGSSNTGKPSQYIAFPKALHRLKERVGATPEEMAAWILRGPNHGGIAAYRNANELSPPPRFSFGYFMGDDYLAPLMYCWFREEEINSFHPTDRYITGNALIERWNTQPGIQAKAFIQAKIEESRLVDLHPIHGGTRASFPEQTSFPPLESGLFLVSDVEAIEGEDFVSCEETPSRTESNSCQAVAASEIRRIFRVLSEPSANTDWWKKVMRDAKRYGLVECRVGSGKRGSGGSLWRPDLVAGWLVDRHAKGRQGLNEKTVGVMLKQFPGCAEIAETLFPVEA